MIESLISIAFCLSSLLTLIILLLPSQYEPSKKAKGGNGTPRPTVQILVLGDIGRSPRMQYHALSVARKGGKVDIIGYQESDPHPEILTDPNITIVPLRPHPPFLQTSNKILFILYGPLKVLFQVAYLWKCLAYTTAPAQWMIVQNPPSIPTLVVASVSCFLRHTRLIIDWHNFGYTILALKLGRNHPLVKVSTWYERTFAQSASVHFCVTDAMGSVLKDQFNLRAPILTLHDRPANHFHPIQDPGERKKFLVTLPGAEPLRELLESGGAEVLVSSTSWTPDEDFSVLIEALQQYSEQTENEPCLPHILAVITGKGPQKEMYMRQIAALEAEGKLKKVTIRTAWLTVQDYAQLLASASLGVSLHTSSSGVDLPMKVVDMFGAGLPVVGWNRFKAWPELVTEGVNGMGFGSAAELTDQLVTFFKYPQQLDRLRTGAQMESGRRWEDEWDPIAGTLLGLT